MSVHYHALTRANYAGADATACTFLVIIQENCECELANCEEEATAASTCMAAPSGPQASLAIGNLSRHRARHGHHTCKVMATTRARSWPPHV